MSIGAHERSPSLQLAAGPGHLPRPDQLAASAAGPHRRRVVVTGGAGFIGANLARALLRSGTASMVTVLDDLSTGDPRNLDGVDDVDMVVGSILDERLLSHVCQGADGIVHLAARASVPESMADPVATHEVNVRGTLNVLEAARRAGGVQTILASSAAVYGRQDSAVHHEGLPPAPESPYAVSKLTDEHYAATYARAFGVPTLTFRFFNVFGTLQPADHVYAAAIPAFVDAVTNARPVTIHGDGQQTRDFVHVSSVTSILCQALVRRVCDTSPINLASGVSRSLNEVLGILEQVVERPIEVVHAEERAGDLRHSRADTRRLAEFFPEFVPTSLEDGLRETVQWFPAGGRGASAGPRLTTARSAPWE